MRKLLLFCSVMLCGFVAGAQCVASFTATASPSNNALLQMQFNNTSSWGLSFSGQLKLATFYYGDGNTASVGTSSPFHTYASPGTYTVSLVVRSVDSATGSQICKDSIAKTVTVTYPVCGSTISVSGIGKTKNFTATTPSGATGMSYSWDFGDSNTGTGATPSHTYANNGTYTVTLTATQGSSPIICTYTNVINVVVYTPPPALVCSTLAASFTTSVTNNVASVSNTSSTVSSQYKMDSYWNWGDGSPVVLAQTPPPHTYTAVGVYTITLQVSWHDSLFTTSCNSTTTRTVSITSIPPPPNIISGNIFYSSSFGTNFFKVWLIKLDTATNILSAVDSQITANTAVPYYAFATKPAGSYRIKAAVHLGSMSGTGLIPTYHDSSVYWSTAKVINHTGLSSINKNVYMRTGTVSSGPGFIGGNVSLGANKGSATGVSGLIVFLRNATMRVVEMALTDASGNYSFSSIPLGAYSVWPELLNYQTIPRTPIVLNGTYPTAPDIHFNQDDMKRSIMPRSPLSIAAVGNSTGSIIVSPVPASNKVTLRWNGLEEATSQFDITSLDGKIVGHSPVVRGKEGSVDLDISKLSKGVYMLHGRGSLAGSITKLVIQ